MKSYLLTLLVVAILPAAALRAETPAPKKIAEWVSLTCPTEAKVGEAIEVSVQLHDIAPGTKVKADLHWRKQNGQYGGFNIWGGPAQEVTATGQHTFRLKAKEKPEIGSVHVYLYLSPTGDHKDRTQDARGPDIKIIAP